ncbi:MAG: TrmB family transcriptional regulator [Thermoprotei archaeon]|nr:MAG: TrmB family transcriptional regulator [Thermoprotei archaeon]
MAERRKGELKEKILQVLKTEGPLAPEEIAVKINYDKINIVKALLTRMVKQGIVEKTPEGKYRIKA